jgi:hypothetical protein
MIMRIVRSPAARVVVVSIAIWAYGQIPGAPQRAAGQERVPRTPWGDPDLQGIWTNNTATPFERPRELAGRERLTDAEVAALEADDRKRSQQNNAASISGPEHWYEHYQGVRSQQTSLVVDPPDGSVPPLTSEAQTRPVIGTVNRSEFSTWEDLSPWDRCITRGIPGSMLPTFYNNNYQILQAPGYVVILYEMIHDARVIPVDGRAHLSEGLRQWMGDSRGHWEGETLVVEVANFTDKTPVHAVRGIASKVAHSQDLRVTERFTRIGAHAIQYRATVADPKTFLQPWTIEIPMTSEGAPDRIFEYACHEGNYAVSHILSGSNAQRPGSTKGNGNSSTSGINGAR